MIKNWFISLFLLVLATSCGTVYFSSPQPANGKVVKVFDEKIRGFYSDSTLDIRILADSVFINGDHFKLTTENPDSDKVLVKFYKDFYFASLSDSVYFNVFMASFYDNKLAIYMLNPDERSIEILKRAVDVQPLDGRNGSYLISPSKKEFNEIIDWELFDLVSILTRK
jgi:hypothetical protein